MPGTNLFLHAGTRQPTIRGHTKSLSADAYRDENGRECIEEVLVSFSGLQISKHGEGQAFNVLLSFTKL